MIHTFNNTFIQKIERGRRTYCCSEFIDFSIIIMFFQTIFLTVIIVGFSFVQAESEAKLAPCGGTIVNDGDSFSYPGPGSSIVDRETCVWTIHLDTLKDFKIDFKKFQINSTQQDCSDAGVRIYSLTNLVPTDQYQSHTFCNARQPPSNLFLSGNLAVLIFYVNSPNSFVGTEFTVSWEGTTYDNLMPQHISSFSTASSGSIRYPIIGPYERNLVATWLVKSQEAHEALQSDISLTGLNLESCNNPVDPCYCDALIVYEVTPQGKLNETQRFCEDTLAASLQKLESQFIVAFFTDFNSEAGSGDSNGFDLIYYPSGSVTGSTLPTTTTENTPTTQLPGGPVSKTCGAVLEGSNYGQIAYKAGDNETYDPGTECFWTIRIPNADSIYFELVQSGVDQGAVFDSVAVTSFNRTSQPLLDNFIIHDRMNRLPNVTVRGNVAIVSFHSDYNSGIHAPGFIITYRGVGESTVTISDQSRSLYETENAEGDFRHPAVEGLNYDYNELTTFLLYPPTSFLTYWNITVNGLDTCCECDFVQVYYWRYENRAFLPAERFCRDSNHRNDYFSRPMLYVFVSDYIHNYAGFQLTWWDS